jgi:hypothetical protein
MYQFLDVFFLVLHSALILFNLFGWIWKKTRKLNLITLSLTGLSWIGLGIFFGWGYCFLTDWHWRVLQKLGISDLPDSYVQYLLGRILGIRISAIEADYLTGIFFLLALMLSVYLNLKNRTKL